MTDRLTVSLDDETRSALDRLASQTTENQSELVRQAITFYESNLEVIENDDADSLWRYSRALNTQDHVLLDRDFLHLFLKNCAVDDEEFEAGVERIASYHVPEFDEEFDSIPDLLEWLAFCGFLRYKRVGSDRVQLIFHDENVKDVMGTFTVAVIEGLGYDVDVVQAGITKLVLDIPSLDR